MAMPDEVKETWMEKMGQHLTRQTIATYTRKLETNNLINRHTKNYIYWYIFLIAIFCAIFSKQIDNVMARVIKGKRNRIVFYGVFCAVMLGIICFLIYGALSRV